jgi:sugar phosphate isomerase/epimerase
MAARVNMNLYRKVRGRGLPGEGLRHPVNGDKYDPLKRVKEALSVPYEGEVIVSGCWIFAISHQGYHMSFEDVLRSLERMKKVGFRYIELEGVGEEGVRMMYHNRTRVKDYCDELGLKVVNYATILPDFRDMDPRKRSAAVELFSSLGIDTAKTFPECRTIQTDTFHPWVVIWGKPPYTETIKYESANPGYKYIPSSGYNQASELEALVETFGQCIEQAQAAELKFCVEPRKGEIVDSTGYLLRLIDQLPDLGVVLDTAHLNYGEDVLLSAARLKKNIVYCHLADNNGTSNDHLTIGSGKIDFLNLLILLKEENYNGALALDVGMVQNLDRAVKTSKQRLENMLTLLKIPFKS